MSIKVKHDGNATAAAFASAQGGKGKRAQQDAASMAQTMQSATNAGVQQLRGASAPGATPGRSNAPLTHAPLGHAPNPPIIPGLYGSTRSGVGANDRGGTGGGGGRNVRSGSQSAQDQMAELQLQKMRRDMEADQVVESTSRFGDHSPDAVWDPTNGGRWVRQYRPGEKEAIAADQQLAVKEPYSNREFYRNLSANKEMANLDADLKGKIYKNQMLVDLQKYTGQKRADQAMHPDMITIQNAASNSNKNAQRMITFLSRGGSVSEQNAEPASDKVWGSTDTSGSSRVQTPQTPQQGQATSYDYGKMYEGGGHYYGSGGSVDSGTTDQSADYGGSFDSVGEALQNK